MLIYVDKKKERKRKITIISVVLLGFFIIYANVMHFKTALNKASEQLTNYKSIKHSNSWYKDAQIVYLFGAPKPNIKKIIIIPNKINRETTTIIASILSKSKKQQTYQISPDISDKDLLLRLIEKAAPQLNASDTDPDIIITSDFAEVSDTITQNKMIPFTLNYKTAEKKLSLGEISKYVNTFFPLKPPSTNKIEKEKQALETFAEDNILWLKNLKQKDFSLDFSKQNLFLKNVRVCLINRDFSTFCGLSNHASFLHNLQKSLFQTPTDTTPTKIILLTSDEPFNPKDISRPEKDEGLHFHYQKREAILLPSEIMPLTNSQQILYTLKQKAGINPQHEHPYMKYYKFKTVEIDLNDNI